MRPGDWVVLDLPEENNKVIFENRKLSKKWKVVEYPFLEDFFGWTRDAAKIYNESYGELITPKKYLRYDNYPELKLLIM